MFNYQGMYLLPGMGDEYLTQEQQIWFGREEQQLFLGGVIDADTVDSGNTSYTTILRPGLAMGVIRSSGQLTHWDPYATDGSHVLAGFFIGQQNMGFYGVTAERMVGGILVKGNVYGSRLLIPAQTTYGISGKTYEFLLREQMAGRFLIDDDPVSSMMSLKYEEAIADATIVKAQNNTLFTLQTAAGADVTLTLPAPVPGLKFGFLNVNTTAGTELILEGPATGEYWVAGAAANNVTIAGDTSVPRWVKAVRVTTVGPVYCYVVEA